jgi:uncharacterized membrane protein YbhN (UPF0104 family)
LKFPTQNTVSFLSKPNLRGLFNGVLLVFLFYLLFQKYPNLNEISFPSPIYLILGILCVIPNYALEIYKWQLLSAQIQKRSFLQARTEVLRGLKLGILTPFMSGDYLGRSMGFAKGQRTNAALLNFFNSITQTWTALFFGSFALILWDIEIWEIKSKIVGTILLLISLFFLALLLGLKVTIWKKYQAALDLPLRLKLEVIFFSLLRTLTYLLQYYFVYLAFDIQVSFMNLFIGTNLLLLAKTIGGGLNAIGDLTLRQVVSIFFFAPLGISEEKLIVATFVVWLISVFLPVFYSIFAKKHDSAV